MFNKGDYVKPKDFVDVVVSVDSDNGEYFKGHIVKSNIFKDKFFDSQIVGHKVDWLSEKFEIAEGFQEK